MCTRTCTAIFATSVLLWVANLPVARVRVNQVSIDF